MPPLRDKGDANNDLLRLSATEISARINRRRPCAGGPSSYRYKSTASKCSGDPTAFDDLVRVVKAAQLTHPNASIPFRCSGRPGTLRFPSIRS